MDDKSEEKVTKKDENKVFKRRWWVLFLFCSVNILQGILWNTSSPLSQTLKAVYSWTDNDIVSIALLLKLADAMCVFPASITGKKFGLRFQMMVIVVMMFITSSLRCLPLSPYYLSTLFKIGALTNGVAWRYVEACIGILSVTWFPPEQIMICMGICIVSQAIGGSFSYVIGPMSVSDPVYTTHDSASCAGNNVTCTIMHNKVLDNKNTIIKQLALLYYVEFALVGVFLVCVLFFFPQDPEKPAQEADEKSKDEPSIKEVAKELVKKRVFWLTVLSSSFVIGFFVVFRTILNVVLHPIGVSQMDAGWIGFTQSMSACIFGVISFILASALEGYRKLYVTFLLLISGYCFTWLSLIAIGIFPLNLGQVYASAILGGTFVVAFSPILTEISSNIIYPLPEGIFMNFVTLASAVSTCFTLFILILSGADYRYVTWLIVGAIGIALVLIFFFPSEVIIDYENDVDLPEVQNTDTDLYPVKTSKIQESDNDGMFTWK